MIVARRMAVVVFLVAGCASTTAGTGVPSSIGSSAAQASTSGSGVSASSASAAPASTSGSGVSASSAGVGSSAVPGGGQQVYRDTRFGGPSVAGAGAKDYVYVPSDDNGSVTVIDQHTMKIVESYHVGKLVQHVVADWDLHRLYATASGSNQLVPIDPTTGARSGDSIKVEAPYNLYFTPDGSKALVMAERLGRIDYYDRRTWTALFSVNVAPCDGINHADWSPDGSWFLATCEFSGEIIKIDSASGRVLNRLVLDRGAMPQDVRLAPDGSKFYAADMAHGCVWVIDGAGTSVVGSIATGVGAHGIYPSRDATRMYVSNRGRTDNRDYRPSREGQGSVSVIDPATDQVVATWPVPGGGSPDMGGVSADGTQLWLSGRYDAEVYVFDTTTGQLLARIKVPAGPHGLNVFPQPGRYSLGHTGNYR